MRFLIGILSGAYLAWTVFGSLQVKFTPVYMIVQPPNECSSGDRFVYAGPESKWNVSVEVADE